MFSYTVKVNKLQNPLGKIVGFASLVIEDSIEVHGFRIINGAKGLFVSPPQHKGKGTDESGNEIEKWYDDVRFVGDNYEQVREEIKNSIIEAYGGNTRADTAKGQSNMNTNAETTGQARQQRKPLW